MFLLGSNLVWASGSFDNLSESISTLVTQTDCKKMAVDKNLQHQDDLNKTCSTDQSAKSLKSLRQVSDRLIYSALAEEEMKSIDCSIARWSDLGSKKGDDPLFQDVVNRMNAELPELDYLNQAINRLSASKINAGLKYKNDKKLSADEKSRLIKQEHEQFNLELSSLVTQYNLTLAKIPLSQNPIVKEFIESKISGPFSSLTNVQKEDLKKLSQKVKEQLYRDRKKLVEGQSTQNYSSDLESRLVLNPENLSAVLAKDDRLGPSLFHLQCRIEQREQGHSIISGVATVATLGLSGGAILMGRASQLALLAKNTQGVIRATSFARGMSYAATSVGSVQTVQLVANECSKILSDVSHFKPSCKVSLEEIKVDDRVYSCIQASALGYGIKAASLAKNKAIKNSEIAQFFERRKARLMASSTQSKAAGSRIKATDEKGNFPDSSGVHVEELPAETGWQTFLKEQAKPANGIPYTPPKTDGLKIIRRPDPPVSQTSTTVSSGDVYLSSLGTNKTRVSIVNSMGYREQVPMEVLGLVKTSSGRAKYKVRIFDSSSRDGRVQELSEYEIMKLRPVIKKP
ncbi:MAG: hypothetical protein A2622_04675 [Bdellovibrionales bacterium RIFCSPHIGHO2_01_FULL_40_29]|nr:MAG: hypothetical protein A2622_04675 [Bdellovibrionales bacterium RIFCSPHIGHO2_01_FULL_40_29]